MADMQTPRTARARDAWPIHGVAWYLRSMAKAIGRQVAWPAPDRCPSACRRSTLSGSDSRTLLDIGIEPGEVKRRIREGHWFYDEQS
jgi:hypothetical protein